MPWGPTDPVAPSGPAGPSGPPGPAGSAGAIPAGVVVMWSGAENAIPTGWALCDGNNSTPDLRNRFVIGAGTGGNYSVNDDGGSADAVVVSHSHGGSASISGGGSHTHSFSASDSHTHSFSGSGSDTTSLLSPLCTKNDGSVTAIFFLRIRFLITASLNLNKSFISSSVD